MVVWKVMTLLLMLAFAASATHARFYFNNPALVQNGGKSEFIPYKDCIQSCENCACTRIWPPDLSLCKCLPDSEEDKDKKSVSIPYKECIQSCENCACTLIYPPELSRCICLDRNSTMDSKKPEQVTESSAPIPYKNCMQSCETCACTLVYPPELSDCTCLDQYPTIQNSGHAKLMSTMNKRGLIPYNECIQSCKNCACTRVWPPDLSQCVCLGRSSTKERSGIIALPVKVHLS